MADENEGFTVIWKIKNFTYCLQKKLEPLNSPSFVVNSFECTRWNLLLYPRGVENDKDVSFYLHRKNDGPEKISLDYELCIINADGIPTACVEVKDHSFTTHHGFGASEFISRKDILDKDRDALLPDDTLTVRCRMWYCGIEPSPQGCKLNTCIGIDKGTFKWPIRSFSSLRNNEERTLSLESSSTDYPSMLLKMSLTGGYLQDRHVKIEISQTDAKRPSYVVLNMQVLSVYGKSLEIAEGDYFFTKTDVVQVWKFPPFITKEKLIGKRSLYLPGDVLTLKCNCVLSVGVECEEIEYEPEIVSDQSSTVSLANAASSSNTEKRDVLNTRRRRRLQDAQMAFPDRPISSEVSQGFRSDLQSLYQDQILPDFTFVVGGKHFRVHKALLSARSPIFKVMFTSEMWKSDKDSIPVPDLESETMHRFLLYLYTDIMEENLDWSAVKKLYFVADRYEVLTLKQNCSESLKRSLFPGNALEILALASMHLDDDLKSYVLQFILMNDHLIVGTDEWKRFEKIDFEFVYETMRDIYMMKLDMQNRSEVQ